MRWIKWMVAVVLLLVLAAILGLPRLNDFQREGRLVLPGLNGEVRVVRDEKGMAYIHAADEERSHPGAGVRHRPGPALSDAVDAAFRLRADRGTGRREGEKERHPHADHRFCASGPET